jgi:NADH-quinone oxidoreductase subunit L
MGALRAKMPTTYRTFLVGTLAIAGVPGLSGFFSKDEILAATFAHSPVLWLVGVIGAGFTAFYMTRLLVLTFHGEHRGDARAWQHAHESPRAMTVPLVVLAVLAVAGGYLGVPAVLGGSNRFGRFLEPVVGHHDLGLSHATELGLMAASVGIALVAIAVAWRLYARGPQPDRTFAERAAPLYGALSNAYYVDRLYDRVFVQGTLRVARTLWRGVDVGFIDAIANGVGSSAQALGESWRRWATGNVQHYALSLLIGVLLLVAAVAVGIAG